MYVPIGGIGQWIQIGTGAAVEIGTTRAELPVLLFLHGGPGGTSIPAAAAWKPWGAHFTVVHWDQRGAGRTFRRNGESGCGRLTVDRMVEDGLEVAELLADRLGRRRLLLVGHSWGSVLAVHMLKRRPARFSGFVGTGQLVNMAKNEEHLHRRLVARAERLGDGEALELLRAIGPPPYSDRGGTKTLRDCADRLAEGDGDPLQPRPSPRAPDFGADEVPAMLRGAEFSREQLFEELKTIDLPALGTSFETPMFVFQGTCDQHTPFELAERYLADLAAPYKELVRFEGCHHFVVMNRPDAFLRELVARVRPRLLDDGA